METHKAKIFVILLLSLVIFSCGDYSDKPIVDGKNVVFEDNQEGYTIKGGGLCYSVEYDGDCAWYCFIPDSITSNLVPKFDLQSHNSFGSFYRDYHYSCSKPDYVDKECNLRIFTNAKGEFMYWKIK